MNTYYLGVELNLPQDIKIVKLKQKLGYSGFGLYIELLLKLAQAEQNRLPCDYGLLAYETRLQPEIIKQIVEGFDLFFIEDGYFFCKEVKKKMKLLSDKKKKLSEAGRLGNIKRWHKIEENEASPPDCHPIATQSLSDLPPNRNKINKENKENKENSKGSPGNKLPDDSGLAKATDTLFLNCKTVNVDLANSTVGGTVHSVENEMTRSISRGRAGVEAPPPKKAKKSRLDELYDKIDKDDRFTSSVKELLKEWVASREELGQKVSTIALSKNTNVIANLNPDGQIRSITEAIKKGWRGLFVVKQGVVYTNQWSKASINANQMANSEFEEEEIVNSFRAKTKQEEDEETRKMMLEILEEDPKDRQN